MRYLAQLARETTARVLPKRGPSWAPAIPALEQETVVEWPAFESSAPLRERPAAHRDLELPVRAAGKQALPDQEPLARTSSPGPAAPTAPPRRSAEREPDFEVRSAPSRQPTSKQPGDAPVFAPPAPPRTEMPDLTPARPSVAATQVPLAATASSERAAPQPPREPEPPRQREIPPPAPMQWPATLPDVLGEIARRQELLEATYRAREASDKFVSGPRTPLETASPRITARTEPEEVRLNIGSIVVQFEPPPAAPPAIPQPHSRRAIREPVSRWARSFADR